MDPTPQPKPIKHADAKIICVVGGPGVGKGTQCTKLASDLHLVHISVSDLLRAEAQNPSSDIGTRIQETMREGRLVDFALVRSVLERCLLRYMKDDDGEDGQCRFLVDGFPRDAAGVGFFGDGDGDGEDGWKILALLNFTCSEDTMRKRVVMRGEVSGRVDDNVEIFERRYKGHMQEIPGILAAFPGKVVNVSCEEPLDEVYGALKYKVAELFGMI